MTHENNRESMVAAILLEQFEVAPPPGPVPSTTLPLTHYDVPWVYSPPMKRIFFFKFPHPTQHFLQAALPPLKNSLSLTLQHFFPFASNLIIPPPQPSDVAASAPYIRYLDRQDSLLFTVKELPNSDFDQLVSDSPQDVRNWNPLIPTLPARRTEEDGTRVVPLAAVQITVLPNLGFSICITFHHIVADGRSLHHFIKYWASICKSSKGRVPDGDKCTNPTITMSLPTYDRDIVKDPEGLKLIRLRNLKDPGSDLDFIVSTDGIVRATLVLSRKQVDKLKKWVKASTFVATSSLVWVCMMKSKLLQKGFDDDHDDNDEICYAIIPADCRNLPELSLPSTYFGNCLEPLIVVLKKGEVVGKNGIVKAANAIDWKITSWKSGNLGEQIDVVALFMQGKSLLSVAGSPRLAVYDTDFGWGKPEKSEAAHLSCGSISVSDCRDLQGGIEIGLVLERVQMNHFINIFEQHVSEM